MSIRPPLNSPAKAFAVVGFALVALTMGPVCGGPLSPAPEAHVPLGSAVPATFAPWELDGAHHQATSQAAPWCQTARPFAGLSDVEPVAQRAYLTTKVPTKQTSVWEPSRRAWQQAWHATMIAAAITSTAPLDWASRWVAVSVQAATAAASPETISPAARPVAPPALTPADLVAIGCGPGPAALGPATERRSTSAADPRAWQAMWGWPVERLPTEHRHAIGTVVQSRLSWLLWGRSQRQGEEVVWQLATDADGVDESSHAVPASWKIRNDREAFAVLASLIDGQWVHDWRAEVASATVRGADWVDLAVPATASAGAWRKVSLAGQASSSGAANVRPFEVVIDGPGRYLFLREEGPALLGYVAGAPAASATSLAPAVVDETAQDLELDPGTVASWATGSVQPRVASRVDLPGLSAEQFVALLSAPCRLLEPLADLAAGVALRGHRLMTQWPQAAGEVASQMVASGRQARLDTSARTDAHAPVKASQVPVAEGTNSPDQNAVR